MIRPAILVRGKVNLSKIVEYPALENIEVTPTKEDQVLKSEKYGFGEVIVKGDENLDPNNIISSKSVYGVQGTYDCDVKIDLASLIGSSIKTKLTNQPTSFIKKIDTTNIDTTGKTSFDNLCNGLNWIEDVILDMRDATTAQYCMKDCRGLKDGHIKLLNTGKLESANYMFDGCSGLTETVEFDTSSVKSFHRMYQNCTSLVTIKRMDCSSAISGFDQFFYTNFTNIRNIEGFVNYGKGFTEKTEKYSQYTLNLSPASGLTREAIVNVFENLYDLNLTYDVANGGTLYRQTVSLGSSLRGKVTAEDKKIATDKGWYISE